MVEATASRARDDDSIALTAEARAVPVERSAPRLSRPLVLLWAALTALLLGFLVFGAVRVGAGNWLGRRLSVTRIWSYFVEFLGEQGASPGVVLLVAAAMGIAVIGSIVLLWLAFDLRDAPGNSAVDDPDPR